VAGRGSLPLREEKGRSGDFFAALAHGLGSLVAYRGEAVYECARWGHVADWLRTALQKRLTRFDSGRGLHPYNQRLALEI
jgi:hypothetical protein